MSSKKSTREELMYSLIYEKIAPLQDTYQSWAMERGHIVESVVKELFDHKNINTVGFLRRTDNDCIGISPDGIIFENGIITKAVEIKAPLGKNFVKYWIQDTIPDEYFYQVVMYFVVIDTLESLDFIIHNPEPYDERVRTKIKTVTRKELEADIFRAQAMICEFQVEWTKVMHQFVENVKKTQN